MRVLAAMMCAGVLAACATSMDTPLGGNGGELGPSPFPVERGSALPPPQASGLGAAPPEGQGPGGLDFGQWRSADPERYAAQFQTAISARAAGKTAPELRADLESNGFACEDGGRLDCRIEISERGCAFDWYVVMERRAEPAAGFDRYCRGAE